MSAGEEFIWYEKHRPRALEAMSMPPQYRKSFADFIASGEIPHLLLFGPQGSGKTTLGFILMDSIPCTRLVLNASSGDRGIETMKTKVKQFASSKTLDGRPKIIFMDEADGITGDAQNALKNTIEAYSKTCRFIFTCNEIDKIIAPIRSRCMLFEFTAFPVDQVTNMAEGILQTENIEYSQEDVGKIVAQHYPDIRSIVNNLQLCSMDGVLDPESVSKNTVDPEKILDAIAEGQVGKIRTMLVGITTFSYIYRYLFDTLLVIEDITSEEKIQLSHVLAEALYRDAIVVNREINFIDCCINIMGVLRCNSISFSL